MTEFHTDPGADLGDRAFTALQHLLPKRLLSRLIYSLMRIESPLVKRALIASFLRGYRVDMSEAIEPDPFAYRHFNDFFTRALKPQARPVNEDPAVVVSPVDGAVSRHGRIEDRWVLQAKGHRYSLDALLAGETRLTDTYRDGSFACLYLAPYNYHRIHMPLAGRLLETVYVPGSLFSVNAATVRALPGVFARNERVICEFETPAGRMALVLIGALFVGSIETVYCGEVNPPPRRHRTAQRIATGAGREFVKGEELARFNMGSTVVMLFERERIHWSDVLQPNAPVRMGRPIARLRA